MDSIDTMNRNFLRLPYNSGIRYQTGGKITRYGATLSGNANPKVLRGYPTGGAEGVLLPLIQGPYIIGGKRRRSRHGKGKMDRIINPQNAFHTYPPIGGTIY